MSDLYESMRAFIRAEVRAEVTAAKLDLLTRDAPKVIEGPPGKNGIDGTNGKDGVNGDDGKDGKDGIEGKPGERGADGIIGRDGKDGLNGTDGKPGDKGERGADGIATRAELDAWFEQRTSDFQARSLADAYQGTFEHAKTYARGHLVSWDGQPWLAMVETRAIPGVSSDWKLFAKKGRDGRDKSK